MSAPTPNYLQKVLEIGLLLERGHLYSATVFHDDWCASNLTGIRQDCNCEPTIEMNPEPITHSEPRIGRNDPCLCGSGQKYKNCCLD